LRDIVDACQRLLAYQNGIDWNDPTSSRMNLDAVMYNLLILGEATKNLPENIREEASDIEWRKIAGIRDVLAHG